MKPRYYILIGAIALFFIPLVLRAAPSYILQRSILPEASSTYDLGSSTQKWRALYVDSCTGCGVGGSATTTINGVSGPTFIFTPGSGLTLASSSNTFTWANNGVLSWNGSTGTVTFNPYAAGFLTSTSTAFQSPLSFPLAFASTTHVTISPGAGITVSTVSGTSTVTNNGVLSLVAGDNILVSSATGTVTVQWKANPASSTITSLNFTNATGTTLNLTNASTTNASTTFLNFTTATGTTLNWTTATGTNLKVTNFTFGASTGILKASGGIVGLLASNEYVSSTSCGAGLTCTATTGAITIANNGVLSLTNGGNIKVSSATGTVTLWLDTVISTTTITTATTTNLNFTAATGTTLNLTNPLTIGNGGTGTTTFIKGLTFASGTLAFNTLASPGTGSLVIGSSTSATAGFTTLAVGSNGKVLTASSTAPGGLSWETSSGGAAANSTTTVDIQLDCNAPQATTTSAVPQLGGSWYQPLIYTSTSTMTTGGWVFSSATSSAVYCQGHIPFDMNATPNASLFTIFSATSTATASSTFDINALVVNPQAGALNPSQSAFTNLVASTSPIIIPTIAGNTTSSIKSFTSPSLSAGQEFYIQIIRYGTATKDTASSSDIYMTDTWLRLDHNVN